jgi:putrescine transport system permease protein
MKARAKAARASMLTAGFAFLYGPILLLIIFSFNASRLVTVWGGLSTRWYAALAQDAQLISSVRTSLLVAVLSATIATFNGTLAAIALVRFGRFRTRTLFAGAIYAPLVMPEVILGLSLLLLFVALGIERGFWTIVAAHATFTMCFVTVVVQSRLVGFDRALEEAAMDLGANPLRTFTSITLPLIRPAIVGGFLLAFTLSLDDLVIASFTAGPGSTTLPMRVYSQVRLGVSPEINAISTLMLAAVGLVLLSVAALSRRRTS